MNIFDIIEKHDNEEFVANLESIVTEINSICDGFDISFESIITGDNFAKKFLSRLGKAISTFSNSSKVKFDVEVFEKIDKSKISKDVTGVATPEYVKTFTDILLAEPVFTKSDLTRMARLTEKVRYKTSADGAIANLLSSAFSGASWFLIFKQLFTGFTPALAFMSIGLDIISIILSIYRNKNTKFTAENMKESEINELLDLTCKLFNSFVGINSTTIDNKSLENADDIIRVLSDKKTTTITVEDQNKVADMLLKVSKFGQTKYEVPKYTMNKSNIKIFKEFISDIKVTDRSLNYMNDDVLDKMDMILQLASKLVAVSEKLVDASNTIMRDIRNW